MLSTKYNKAICGVYNVTDARYSLHPRVERCLISAEPGFVNVYRAQESIPPAHAAWRAGTTSRVKVPASQAWNRFLGFLKSLQIRALVCIISGKLSRLLSSILLFFLYEKNTILSYKYYIIVHCAVAYNDIDLFWQKEKWCNVIHLLKTFFSSRFVRVWHQSL